MRRRRSPGPMGIDPVKTAQAAVKYFRGLIRSDIQLEDAEHIIRVMQAYIKGAIVPFNVWRELDALQNKKISESVRREIENFKAVFRGAL